MLICNMRLQALRQVDLNLFVTFAVIAEEKSITAAAARLHLSQPAVSRALKRARLMFQDDLLVRSPNGFELTLRGRKLLDELNQLLPNMERLVVPNVFNPAREPNTFRLSGPDNVCSALLPHVLRNSMKPEFVICLDVLSWQLGTADMLEHGQLDMAFQIDDGLLPSHLQSERLYREEWICAVARDSSFGERVTLKQYLDAEHLVCVNANKRTKYSRQTIGGNRQKTQVARKVVVLQCRVALPAGVFACSHADQRNALNREEQSSFAHCSCAIGSAGFPHPDGMASARQH